MMSLFESDPDYESLVEVRLLNALTLLSSLTAESADLILTDPPYGISYQSNHRKEGKSAPIATDWKFNPSQFLEEAGRVLKVGSAAYVFTRWDVYPEGRHTIRGHRYSNVWDFPRVTFKEQKHPAEKPVPMLQRAIEASTDEGGLVVDPFCGSGSTAVAAAKLGRRALICDVDTQCLKVCLERMNLPPRPFPGQ